MRTNYRNGDPITLHTGCDGCTPLMINGTLCHESSCTEAWRDYPIECFECGVEFFRSVRFSTVCEDCFNSEQYDYDLEDFDDDDA